MMYFLVAALSSAENFTFSYILFQKYLLCWSFK